MAKLYFRFGTMGSCKTLDLLTTAYNFEEKNIGFMVLKPSTDTRDGSNVVKSRAGIERECVLIEPDTDIYEAVKLYNEMMLNNGKSVCWILVDESQFLSTEQVDDLSNIVDFLNINVICYGLRTDFQAHLFEGSKRLFELADNIEEIKSTCECGHKTTINARIDEDKNIITEGQQVMVGGNESYVGLCRRCWRIKTNQIPK